MRRRSIIHSRAQLISNGRTTPNRIARRFALDALEAALAAINPYNCLLEKIKVKSGQILVAGYAVPLYRMKRVLVLAIGKAAVPMMKAALEVLTGYNVDGILVAPKGVRLRAFDDRVEVFQAGHPVPDIDGLRASRAVKRSVTSMKGDELLLCLISGGASAMLPAPPVGISLHDKMKVTDLLVKSRATIHETTTVRRHISSLKGGQLARLSRASRILSLMISDVPGNNLPDIGSGLTVTDPTTFKDAVDILKRYGLWGKLPRPVVFRLRKGLQGKIPETPKPGDHFFRKVRNIIIADNRAACGAAKRILEAKGIHTRLLTSTAEAEAKNMGALMASIATASKLHERPARRTDAVIIGGETTVEVKSKGLGGRNQETVLSAVEGIAGLEGTIIAALGTDGIDGNSCAAGALADGLSEQRATRIGMDPQDFLKGNDSNRFFKKLKDDLVTGQTKTNVGDVYLVVSRH